MRVAKSPLPKIWLIYPAMIKRGTVIPYPRRFKYKCKLRETLLEFLLWSAFFLPEINNFCYTKKYRYRLYFKGFRDLKRWFIKHGWKFDDISKIGYSFIFKLKFFKLKVMTSYFLSMTSLKLHCRCDQGLVTLRISMREVIITSIL